MVRRSCHQSLFNWLMNLPLATGIPDGRPLVDGDIVNLDVTLYHNGFHGDLNATCPSLFLHLS